jgi:hypothetical protein
MKEPKKIPLTDHPRNKEPQKIRLLPEDNTIILDYLDKDENNPKDNSESIQQLESDKTS